VFTRRFFEQLFEELTQERVLVFDNYQAISGSAVFHKAIVNGLAAVPPGKQVVIMSREAPPAVFSRLKANGNLVMLTWEHLRLSLEESRELARLRGYHLSESQITQVHKSCEGWAAGLVLFLKAGESGGTDRISQRPQGLLDDLFNYFAGEVFDHMEPEIQDLLLKTAYLPRVHAEHARRLTGNPHVEALPLALSGNQYFVTPYSKDEPVYHYHQLFRRYLMAEAERSVDPKSRSTIQHASAHLLLESGNTEEAASLFILAEDWQSLIQVILVNAQNLIEQGCHETLASWINRLPAERLEGSPWISYWLGACELITDLDASRRHFIFRDNQEVSACKHPVGQPMRKPEFPRFGPILMKTSLGDVQ
jgi:ATP/maltotriose-dependent transcriptional regulator MalT